MMKYLTEVERARQHEHAALRQFRSELAQLIAQPAHEAGPARVSGQRRVAAPEPVDAVSSYGYAPSARRSRSADDRTGQGTRRRVVAIAAVLVILLVGWLVMRGGDEQSAGGAHAGHDMSKMGSAAGGSTAMAPGPDVPVDLGEFFVTPKYGKVSAGNVTFDVANSGKAEHEFMVARLEDLPKDEVEDMSSDEVHEKVLAAKHGLTAGAQDMLDVELEPGKYLLFCNLPGHFGEGQSAIIEAV